MDDDTRALIEASWRLLDRARDDQEDHLRALEVSRMLLQRSRALLAVSGIGGASPA